MIIVNEHIEYFLPLRIKQILCTHILAYIIYYVNISVPIHNTRHLCRIEMDKKLRVLVYEKVKKVKFAPNIYKRAYNKALYAKYESFVFIHRTLEKDDFFLQKKSHWGIFHIHM